MDSEVIAAVIGGGSGLAGALLGGTAAVIAARIQARRAVEAGLATAKSTYLAPLDTARRTAQREVYAKLVDAVYSYLEAVARAVPAARMLEELEESSRQGVVVHHDTVQSQRDIVNGVQQPNEIKRAVQHIALEGPETVYSRAQNIEQVAERLFKALRGAGGQYQLPNGSLADTEPELASQLRDTLESHIRSFTGLASDHLNNRDIERSPIIPATGP
ncbi:hypothetical protein ACFUJU_10480 [Streptomyces sp. NPDC057235]|uniref:hypothetical protein n=1 Tax=Streptomyces sp. NPDC057235 TaxID=3346058 RepID=UPI0036302F24